MLGRSGGDGLGKPESEELGNSVLFPTLIMKSREQSFSATTTRRGARGLNTAAGTRSTRIAEQTTDLQSTSNQLLSSEILEAGVLSGWRCTHFLPRPATPIRTISFTTAATRSKITASKGGVMKNVFAIALLCLFSLSLVDGQQASKSNRVEAQIKKQEQNWAEATVKEGAAAVDQFEADEFITTDPTGRVTDETRWAPTNCRYRHSCASQLADRNYPLKQHLPPGVWDKRIVRVPRSTGSANHLRVGVERALPC